LAETCKLDPWPLDEGPRPKKKWQIEAKPTWHCSGGKINLLRPKIRAQRRSNDLEDQDAS